MRILIYGINFTPELTGIGKYTGEMAEWLAKQGHEVRVVTAPPYYPNWQVAKGYSGVTYRKEASDAGLTIYRCPLWVPSRVSGIKRLVHLFSFSVSSLPVVVGQALWRPDWVWVVEPPLFCAPGAWFAAKLCRARTWLHIQDFEVDAAFDLGMLKGRLLRRVVLTVERWLMRRFERVSTISRRMLERLETKGVSTDRLVSFPNWVDTSQVFPMEHDPGGVKGERAEGLRAQLGLLDGAVVALYSGNMGKKQGLEVVVEAAKVLESSDNIRFVFCGQGAGFKELQALAAGLNNVTWLPLQPIERLNELLNMADIHLLPQRADAADLVMPSKLTGILASGRPVVATAAEGTEVWSVVEGCGINTPPGDAAAFAEAIRTLAADADMRAKLGKRGRRYAEENFDRTAVLGRFEAALLAGIAKQPKP